MINVVFLLLIFFMMTSQFAPPRPIDITPPSISEAHMPDDRRTALYIDATGMVFFNDLQGDAVWPALAALPADFALVIAADAALPVPDLARVLARIGPDRVIQIMVRP
jgi:biopolymer transport protein ExbD